MSEIKDRIIEALKYNRMSAKELSDAYDGKMVRV